MAKNILVAGATGFIGTRVCKILNKKGFNVFALILPGCETSHIEDYVAEFISGDLTKPSVVEDTVKKALNHNIEYIISIVGSVDYHQDYETSFRINVETTKNITSIASKLHENKKLKKFVYTGSVVSRGFFQKKPVGSSIIDEKTDCYKEGISIYSDIKRECENLVNNIIKSFGLDGVIVEPGSLVGEEIGNTTTTNIALIKKIIRGFPVLKGGASYSSVEQVAEGIVLAMENGRKSETYLLGGENMSMRDFAFLVRFVLVEKYPHGRKVFFPIIRIPKIISIILGKINLIINSQQALLGNTWHFIDSSKAEDELGYKHSMDDLVESIERVISQFYEN